MKEITRILVFLISSSTVLFAQQSETLAVFLDANFEYDEVFVKRELNYLNYVLDRQNADVYLQIAKQETGKGGEKYALMLAGVQRWRSKTDTLHFFTEPQSSEQQQRSLLVEHIAKILLPYMLETPLREHISFQIKQGNAQQAAPEEDKWKNWVFNLGGIWMADGESSYRNREFGIKATANRVTEQSKFFLSNRYYNEKSVFIFGDESEFTNFKRSYSTYGRYVHSLAPNWSLGGNFSVSSSTFNNYDWRIRLQPAIEYSLYPYEEASTRQLSLYYKIGPVHNNYADTTLLGKTEETVLQHSFDAVYRIFRDWGELSLHLYSNQYLHQPNYVSLTLGTVGNWNITKGLNFELGGYFSYVGDRINVPQSSISREDLLLQTRLVDSSFNYFTYVGINYRFGSKVNNIVNSRFDGYDLNISTSF